MKNTLFFCMALLCATSGFSQPTITASTNNPVAGDKFIIRGCSTSGVSHGAAGAGVTWDFSGLVTSYNDSISFLACAATPYCDSFPGATLSTTFDGSYYDYLVTDTEKFASLGSYDGTDLSRFTNPYAISMFPMTYGSILVDTAAQNYDTTLFVSAIDSFIADGYGTLKLPSGTYENVLRVHIISYETDSVPDPVTPEVTYNRTDNYYWYVPGFRFILLAMFYDTSIASAPSLADVWYCKYDLPVPPPTAVGNIAMNGNSFIYPNPAKDLLFARIVADKAEEASLAITDLTGKEVLTLLKAALSPGINTISCNTSSLAPGIYVAHLTRSSGNFVEKIIIDR